jgi:hypothetical protein
MRTGPEHVEGLPLPPLHLTCHEEKPLLPLFSRGFSTMASTYHLMTTPAMVPPANPSSPK